MTPNVPTDDLIAAARFGVEIEASLRNPAVLFILQAMAAREEEAITALLDADPDTEPHLVRRYQAEAKRFRAMQQDIEQVVNDGREAHRVLSEQELVDDG